MNSAEEAHEASAARLNAAVCKLNDACINVARAANELEIEPYGERGVMVSRGSWNDLQDALKAWRLATHELLEAQ